MSGDDDVLLGRAELERAFAALGERLASRDVIVVRGAAMALAYDAKRVTRDVDARFVPHDIVLAEARRVAAEARIPAQGRDGCLCRMVGCCSWPQRSSTPRVRPLLPLIYPKCVAAVHSGLLGQAAVKDLPVVDTDALARAAALLRARNAIDAELAQVMKRPMTSGHLGEWIAAQIFDIELQSSAAAAGIDGHFRSGALHGRSVNIKWYLKREGLLDITDSPAPDYYLVLTGPSSAAASSRGTTRPWCIEAVFLFDAQQLRTEQTARGVKQGVVSSITKQQWAAAQIHPPDPSRQLAVTPQQAEQLRQFAP